MATPERNYSGIAPSAGLAVNAVVICLAGSQSFAEWKLNERSTEQHGSMRLRR